ncbi:histone methylation DOT1, partial [Mycena belliarum]
YDSMVSPNIAFVKGQKGSRVYGELKSEALQTLCGRVGQSLKQGSLFLDIGAGIGHAALFLALTTGCNTIAYEFTEAPAKLAAGLYRGLARRAHKTGYSLGTHQYVYGDVQTQASFVNAISAASVILWNNKAFE